jgi:hypothetical protein
MSEVDEIGTKTGDGDLGAGCVLKALSKLCGCFAMTTRELPQVADSGLCGGRDCLAAIVCSAG